MISFPSHRWNVSKMKEEEKVAHDLISNVEKSSIFILVSKSEFECDGRSSNCKTILSEM